MTGTVSYHRTRNWSHSFCVKFRALSDSITTFPSFKTTTHFIIHNVPYSVLCKKRLFLCNNFTGILNAELLLDGNKPRRSRISNEDFMLLIISPLGLTETESGEIYMWQLQWLCVVFWNQDKLHSVEIEWENFSLISAGWYFTIINSRTSLS